MIESQNTAFERAYQKTTLSIDNVEKFAKKIWDSAICYAEEHHKQECVECKQKKPPYKLFGVD